MFSSLVEFLKQKKFYFIQTYFKTISEEHKKNLLELTNATLYPSIAINTTKALDKQKEILINNVYQFLRDNTINKVN